MGSPAAGGRSLGALLPGGQALVGAGGDRPGAALFGAVGGPLLAGLQAGLDGTAGDGGHALLGQLLVLLEGRGGHPRRQQLDLFAAAGTTPLLGRRRAGGAGELRIQLQERGDPIRPPAAGRHHDRPRLSGPAAAIAPRGLLDGPVAGVGAAGKAAGLAVFLADRAVAAGAALALELAFAGAGDAGPGAGQPEADAGLGDDLQQPGRPATKMLGQPVIQVLRPVLE
jgi:hypothetical protein